MKRIITLIAALAAATMVFAQAPLPNDPAVKVGKLDNGLTYYIRHNDKPAQRAEFYLATNVGAIQEAPDQDGLAHFLEHMCFNGLKNLPGKQMLEYLQKIGAEFGRNINASTGVEVTQYMLNNIPVIREGIIDTCLLVMHDYSHFVLNEPDEIDAERGVILEERRTRRNAAWRLHEQAMPYMYGDSKYAGCTIIGSEENLKTFKPESLVNFYQTWYRPDNQALIVVGDIDVDQIEAKIKDLFADIPAPVDPKAKDVIMIPDNEEPIVGITTDPECTSSAVTVLWKSEPLPEEYNNTNVAFITDILKDIIYSVMAERFQDITAKPDAPYFSGMLGFTNLVETCEALYGEVACRDGEIAPAFEAFFTEIEKAKRFGFSDAEIQRAKDSLLSWYEKQAEAADTRKNAEFIRPLIQNFFDNEAFLDPQVEYSLAQQIMPALTAQMINQTIAECVTDDNLVVIAQSPASAVIPTEQELRDIIVKVRNAEIEAPASEEIATELLDPASLKGGKVKKSAAGMYGSTEWILKNGVKVVVLPTDYKKDQVMIRLRMEGGRSLIATEDLPSFEDNIWSLFQSNTGVGEFSGTQLAKMLSAKNVSVGTFINPLNHGLSATSTPKDLETALQLMYLSFTQPRFDADEYAVGVNQIKSMLPSLMTNPSFVLQDRLSKTIYDSPRKFFVNEDIISKADIATVERVTRSLFKDAAGAVVYIVGNVNPSEIKPLVEKYIGSLPKGKKASNWVDTNEGFVKGEVIDHFNVPMQTPTATVLQVYTADTPWSVKDQVMLEAANYVLDMIYTATLREEEGGTYGASVANAFNKFPKDQAVLQVYFDTNVEQSARLCELAKEGLKRLAYEGPTDEELTRTIENFKKNIPENHITNGYWLSALSSCKVYGIDYDAEWVAACENITAEDIKAIAKKLYESGNFIEMKMMPQE